MSKITVIIPCYNASAYIERCLDALASQSYRDFSVITVDDCSKDDTIAVIEAYRAKSSMDIQILKNEKNSGPAASRNKGIESAESSFIAFCDADDWYDSNFLAELMAPVEKDGADLVLCGHRVVDENGKAEERPIVSQSGTLDVGKALQLESDSLCMLLVKAETMKDTLLPNIRNGEDVAVVPLLIAKSKKIAVTEKCLYHYFRRSDSASQSPNAKVVKSLRDSYTYLSGRFPKEYPTELEFLGIKNMLYPTLISLFTYSYDTKTAKEILNGFEAIYPNWEKNPYIYCLPKYKKIVLSFAGKRLYLVLKMIAFIRACMT